ncbi:MAG: hypothetical protein RLZZ28_321 [Bacteroidota bacterium]
MRILLKIFYGFFVFCTAGFSFGQSGKTYRQEISDWQASRESFLLSPGGWINLEGLFWLKPGKNEFGSDALSDIVYPNTAFPKSAGYFIWEGNKVSWTSAQNITTSINDTVIASAVLYEEGKKPPVLAWGKFRWNIIKRDDKMGVRFRNLDAAALKAFGGIERFSVKEKWRVPAHLEAAPAGSLQIANVLGQVNEEKSPGKLLFTLNGKKYRLDALTEGDQLFILFADATSGKTTYPTGRFLYAALPDANGNTVLDFNKSFNPPCAFTVFATCPIPPKQNILPIAIEAGEKDYGGGEKKK